MLSATQKCARRRCNSSPAWLGHRAPPVDIDEKDMYRCDGQYFTYYRSLRPHDPRLLPPLYCSHFPNFEPSEVDEYAADLHIPPFKLCEVEDHYTAVPQMTIRQLQLALRNQQFGQALALVEQTTTTHAAASNTNSVDIVVNTPGGGARIDEDTENCFSINSAHSTLHYQPYEFTPEECGSRDEYVDYVSTPRSNSTLSSGFPSARGTQQQQQLSPRTGGYDSGYYPPPPPMYHPYSPTHHPEYSHMTPHPHHMGGYPHPHPSHQAYPYPPHSHTHPLQHPHPQHLWPGYPEHSEANNISESSNTASGAGHGVGVLGSDTDADSSSATTTTSARGPTPSYAHIHARVPSMSDLSSSSLQSAGAPRASTGRNRRLETGSMYADDDEDLNTGTCSSAVLSLLSDSSSTGATTGATTSTPGTHRGTHRKGRLVRVPPRVVPEFPTDLDAKIKFLLTQANLEWGTLQCRITREKKVLYTRYEFFLEVPDPKSTSASSGTASSRGLLSEDAAACKTQLIFLCAAKRPKQKSLFLISADHSDFEKKSKNYVAKCRKNLSKNDFTLLIAPMWADQPLAATKGAKAPKKQLNESAAVAFTKPTKYMPSQMQVVLSDHAPEAADGSTPWLLQRLQRGDCEKTPVLVNTPPQWNTKTNSYEVDFGGRVVLSSGKNLQLQDTRNKHKPVVLTFGKADEASWVLDFCSPLSPVQAFSIALTAFNAL